MGFADRFRDLFAGVTAVPDLARAERVASLVPPDTVYISVGQFLELPDALDFVGGTPGQAPYRHEFGALPPAGPPREVGLLALAGGRLGVFDATGPRWSIDAALITDLDGHRHSGFVVLTRERVGLALTTQTPVELGPAARWRTVGRVTNVFGGWDKELAPYHPKIHW